MSFRHVTRTVALSIAALVCGATLTTGILASPAGASTLLSADGFTSLSTQGTVAAQTPYASGQMINITVAANSTMNNAAMVAAGYPSGADAIKFLECADPGGTSLPTAKGECDPGTVATISGANNDGSMNGPPGGFQVLALPDPNLGGGPITCAFAPNYCVIGMFADQNDFTKPHLFSAPFVVAPDGGADSGQPAGDGTSTPISITSASSATFETGAPGSFQVTGTGTPPPTTFTETGTLPTGVNLSPSGLLSGTTTQTGNFPITIDASDGGVLPDATQSFTLSVVSTLTSSDGFTSISTRGAVTSDTPYSSGQIISVQVAANPTLDQANLATFYPDTGGVVPMHLVECADPNGTAGNLPTSPSQCEPGTIETLAGANPDGSLNAGPGGYQVLALPDVNLGSGNPITCDVAPNACVIGVFANQNDFTKPHLFSAPFQVSSNGGADDGSNPGDGTSSANAAPVITSAASTTFTGGVDGSFQVTASGFPGPSFSETGTLPTGVNLSPSGLLSGSPDPGQTGPYPITITASNGVLPQGTQSFTLSVVSTLTSSDGFTSISTRGAVTSDTPYSSGQIISVQVAANPTLDQANLATFYPDTGGVVPMHLVECADPNGTAGNLPTSPSQCEPGTIETLAGANPDGSLNAGPGGYQVLALPDVNLGSGNPITCDVAPNACVIGVFANQNDFTKPHLFSAPFQVSSNGGADDGSNPGDGTSSANAAPVITSAASTTFTGGVDGSFQVTASGFPGPSFSETGPLPTGVTFSPSGLLSGYPGQTGTFPITITAINGIFPQASQNFTLTVTGSIPGEPTITSVNHYSFVSGSAPNFTVTATGSPPPTFSVTGNLDGLTIDPSSGVLSGTPTTSGIFQVTIAASNGVGLDALQTFTLTVQAAPVITSASHYSFATGGSPNFTVAATGYPAPTFSVTGNLDGLTVNPTTGALSGNAALGGTFPVTITASNGVSPNAAQSFTLTVVFHVSTTSLPNATVLQPYGPVTLHSIGAASGASLKWKKVASLPKGLKLSSTGVLSGTPNKKLTPGNFTVSVQVTEKYKIGRVKSRVIATVSLTLHIA